MQKRDLVAHVKLEGGLTLFQAQEAVNAVLSGITKALSKGESVVLTGFGSLKVKHREAYTARHPSTGASVDVPHAITSLSKAGKLLNEAVND